MKTRVLAIATVAVALAADSRSHFGPRIGWLRAVAFLKQQMK
jgi:hypothetical protein